MRKLHTLKAPLLGGVDTYLHVSIYAKALSVFVLLFIVPLESILSSTLEELELPLILKLQEIGEYQLIDSIMYGLTFLAQSEIILILGPALYHIENPRRGVKVILISCFTIYAQCLLELIYSEPRPFWVSPDIHAFNCEVGFGHPSSLILHTTLFYYYAYFQICHSNFTTGVLFIVWIFILAFSRVYSGNSFIHQVISSLCLSFFLIVLILASDDWLNSLVYKSAFNYRRYRKYTVYWFLITIGLLVVAVVIEQNINPKDLLLFEHNVKDCDLESNQVAAFTFKRVAFMFYNYGIFAGSMHTHKLLAEGWWRTRVWKRLIRFAIALAGSTCVYWAFYQLPVADPVTSFVFLGVIPFFTIGYYNAGVVPWAAQMLRLNR
mmetsp:Transcript_26092/g.46344  ORF Transcript_26092/g.46344 Transcript_26092/m.46344 type:complete len:378 (-) Transcript_26092:34-1167(-)